MLKKKRWEGAVSKLTAVISAVIAICISCSVVHRIAWMYGLGVREFTYFLTFSDYLDISVRMGGILGPLMLSFGLWYLATNPRILAWLASDEINSIDDVNSSEGSSRSRWARYGKFCWKLIYKTVGVLGAVAILAVVVVEGDLWLIAAIVIVVVLVLRAFQVFPKTNVVFGAIFIVLLVDAAGGGYSAGKDIRIAITSGDIHSFKPWHVVAKSGDFKEVFAVAIDRGVVVFDKSNLRLFPWSEVLLVEAPNNNSALDTFHFQKSRAVLTKVQCYTSGILSATFGRRPWVAADVCYDRTQPFLQENGKQ